MEEYFTRYYKWRSKGFVVYKVLKRIYAMYVWIFDALVFMVSNITPPQLRNSQKMALLVLSMDC